MSRTVRTLQFVSLCVTLGFTAQAVPTPYWFDGFDVSANTSDINFEAAAGLRQGGFTVPYLANTPNPANDYHHQMFGGGGPLQLAGDVNPPWPAHTLVSPNNDFAGLVGNQVIGKKVSVVMDAGAFIAGAPYFLQSAITIGGTVPLQQAGSLGSGFSVVFVEDTFGGNGDFIQIWNGSTLIDNLIPNPAGPGGGFVELFVDDLSDGNPWDGVGSTTIDVYVNGVQLVGGVAGPWTIPSLTANYITLEGSDQKNGVGLATHSFDNLTVYTEVVPEPSTFALIGLGLVSTVFARRRKA
jgi:hypothetical protein